MSLLSINLIVKEKDGAQSRVPVITPWGLEEAVKNLHHQKCWNIVRVVDNTAEVDLPVIDGVVQKEAS